MSTAPPSVESRGSGGRTDRRSPEQRQADLRSAELHLETHFENPEKQLHAAHLGMWVFLGSEVTFFSALFVLFASYRTEYTHVFAEAARHTDLWLGTANTYVLLTASLLVALAVYMIRGDRHRPASWLLFAAAGLGIVFEILKGTEYAHHFNEGIYPGGYYHFAGLQAPGAREFFSLYYLMTGLHALHVLGGIILLAYLGWRARRGAYDAGYHTPLELGGMYWHFVDMVWLFLWPAFYLMRWS